MHIQVVNFQLNGLSEEAYTDLCTQLAPAIAALPGLISKVFLADRDNNTYGGVYTWRDRQAMEDFTRTDIFNAVVTHPNLANITSKDFGVLEEPTRITQGLAAIAV